MVPDQTEAAADGCVIGGGAAPSGGGMADGAVVREPTPRVFLLKISLVARHAVLWAQGTEEGGALGSVAGRAGLRPMVSR